MRYRRYLSAAVAMAAVLCFTGGAFGQVGAGSPENGAQIIEQIGDKGKINWTGGYIEAVGIGAPAQRDIGKPQARPNALRAARIVAYRDLLEVTKGVRVDSTTTILNFTVESDIINTQVQGIVKGAKVVKEEYMSDGTVEVTVRMPLAGEISGMIITRLIDKKPLPAPPAAPPTPPAAAPTEVFTGLVVDARGIQARPAMSPRIIDENGKEVYGAMNVEREYAVQQGMSGYARDLTAAQSNPRVTNSPMSAKGLKTDGAGRSDIVIANADAEKIRGVAENMGFLKKCRVMIVLD